jgi:hypothetical protein
VAKLSLEMAVQSPNAKSFFRGYGTHPRINAPRPRVACSLACSSPVLQSAAELGEWDRYQPPTPIDRTGFQIHHSRNLIFSVTSSTEAISSEFCRFEALGRQNTQKGSINATLRLKLLDRFFPQTLVKQSQHTGRRFNPADANEFQHWDSTWDRLVPQNPQLGRKLNARRSRTNLTAKIKRCLRSLLSVMLGRLAHSTIDNGVADASRISTCFKNCSARTQEYRTCWFAHQSQYETIVLDYKFEFPHVAVANDRRT